MNQTPLPLRDIHLPDTVLWWPLALGWWFIIAILLILVLGMGWFYYVNRKSKQEQQIVADALIVLQQLTEEENKAALIRGISRLLRRVCISLYGRQQVAGLTGERWLRFLDRKGKTTAFSQGIGRLLLDYPYQQQVDYSRQALLTLVQAWLQQQRKYYV